MKIKAARTDGKAQVSISVPVQKVAHETPFQIIAPTRQSGLLPLFNHRLRPSTISRDSKSEDFYSDKSRIVFCSSFRRLVQKAQVFSLESNISVRNRLTHSLEVADIGRTIARKVGKKLHEANRATEEDVECIQSIVENACLLHDIGNPPFGHFGEFAIKNWFVRNGTTYLTSPEELNLELSEQGRFKDLLMFDGNPQGFRIATKLHCDVDKFGLNLTISTLLASVKYPNCGTIDRKALFPKKLGVFFSERDAYRKIVESALMPKGRRYFLSYLMELADDICYCLSDISDSFEKGIVTSRDYKAEFRQICKENAVDGNIALPSERITNFSYQISIPIARLIIDEAAVKFCREVDEYIMGTAKELADNLPSAGLLRCLKQFARRFIYTNREVQRIEIAGAKVVDGLLEHFGQLLKIPRADFIHFVKKHELPKDRNLDTEWRIFNQLSKRMLRVYTRESRDTGEYEERIVRARLIVDYISGMTDNSALGIYQNFTGIHL